MSGYFNPQENDEDFGPSKSDQKRSSDRLQALGERLAAMSESQLSKLPIDEALLKALLDMKRIKAHEAIQRAIRICESDERRRDEFRRAAGAVG